MNNIRIIESINKGLLALGVLLMLSTLSWAQNGNGNGNGNNKNKNTEEEPVEEAPIEEVAPIEAAAAAAPGGGGGGPSQPAAPNSTISVQAYNCGSTRLTRSSGPSGGIWWSWNSTYYTPGGSTGTVGITTSTYDVTTTGTVYLQSYDYINDIWGGYISYNVTQVNSTPAMPSMATVQNNCGNSVVSYTSGQASGQNWHWQTSASGTVTDPVSSTLSKTFTSGSTIYVRAKSALGCWSTARTVGYAIKSTPATPLGPATNDANCTNAVVGYDAVIANGKNWHWQTTVSGEVIDPVDQTLSKTFYSDGTIYVRAKNAQGCWSSARAINYNISVAPNVPAVAAVQSNCGNAVVSYASVQASGQNWHWQTSASGTATDLVDHSLSKTFYSNGTIYVRAKSAQGCWSAARQINYTIKSVPGVPAVATVQNNCGNSVVSYTSGQASGQNWHWQTSASGTVTDPVSSTLSKTFTSGNTIYVRAKSAQGCWSTARTVGYAIKSIPATPFDPTTNDKNCGSAFVEYDPDIVNGRNWHWQSTADGTVTDLVDNNLSKTFYTDGTIYVRAKNTQDCWSVAKRIDYFVNPIPDLAIGNSQNQCGDGSITLTATPGTGGNNIKWYSSASPANTTPVHTGLDYTFNLTADVTYYVASYNSTTFCEDTDRVAVTADWKEQPAPFTVGGGAAVCPGNAISVTLSGSETGTTYTLYRGTTSTGQSKNGTGGPISFDNQTFSGTYTIVADRDGCPATMPGSAVLSHLIVPTPDIPTVGDERCGPKTVTKVGTPPQLGPGGEPVYWYWMGTDPDNPNPTAFGATQSVTQTGTYFIRAQEGFPGQGGCWSAPILVNVTVDYPQGFPDPPLVGAISVTTNTCDAKMASTTQTLPAGQDFYWQGLGNAATAIDTDPGSTSDPMTTGGTYYMRTRTDEGCFSDPVSFDVDGITIRPLVKTIAGPATNQYADTPVDYRKIRIDNSESHVEYRVQKNGVDIGNDFHGSGTTARSSLIMEDGDYTVVAIRNGCETEMGQTISIGSDTNHNSGTSHSYTVPATENSLPTLLGEVLTSTSYADGMGRPLQSVVKQVSPDQKDMVSFYEYDDLGRMTKQYLPYVADATGILKSDPKTAQTAFYQAAGDHIANDTRPFSETIYETSPISRLKKQFGVGQAWYDADNGEGRKASVSYETNVISDPAVIHWQVVNDELVNSGTYAVGQLYKTTGTNEDNHQVMTFTNKVGQTVLKKVKSGVDTWAETYNVYDKQGRLRFVIPPLALEEYNAPGFGDPAPPYGFYLVETTTNFADVEVASEGKIAYTPGAVIHVNQGDVLEKGDIIQSYDPADQVGQPADFHLSDLIFQYRYDHRHRLIEKRVPGADWVYMVYDDRDRVVLTQDGNQRTNNKWSFVKYDQLNRSIITGEKVISGTVDAIRTAVANATVFYETYDATGLMNYTNLAYPAGITADEIYTVSYYDNYDFTSKTFSLPANVFTDLSDHRETPAQTAHALKGLATGAKTKVLGTTTFLETVNFYDDKYRVVQSISDNHKGGRDITTVQYNFAGQVMKTYVDHNPDGAVNNSTTIAQVYTYDHVGRSLTTTHSIDNATPVTIASYTYNELGALENKTLADGFEDIDYEYNIRGWITQMNNPNDSEDHLFEMEFKYETATNKQYNGNIGEVAWKNPYESTTSSFDYTYDEMNRLKTADYDHTGTSTRDYGLESISYDANSNIKTLKRKGDHNDTANQSFDDLTYDYDGNRLMAVTDNAAMDTGFKNGVDDTIEYSYDANGNLTADKNKGITSITYNHINQPTKVTYDAGKYIEYSYSASGAKVSQTVVENGTSTTTDYLGGFLYQNDTLQIIAHSQGRIIAPLPGGAGGGYEYQYHLTDHLGNVRVTFKTEIDQDIYDEATFEDVDTTGMKTYFEKYEEVTRIKADLFDHTGPGGAYSLWLDGSANKKIGLAKSLMVKPGDVIDMEVWAKYYDNNNSASWTALLNTLASEIASGAVGTVYDGAIGATGLPFVDFLSGNRTTDAAPDAYINYFVFDSNYELISAKTGFQKVSTAAEEDGTGMNGHEKLSHSITIDQPGYVYIYLSNEESTPIDVFFDDFKVTQTHSPVVQKSDYQAFGLEFNSYSREVITKQNFKFNAGSEFEEMTDWYSTPFRKYDPSLGRFHGVDALADLYSSTTPSHFAMNDPINYNDPTGLNTAPKSENKMAGGGGGNNRHLPDGLGPNNARARWTSLYDSNFGSPDRYALVYMANRINNNSGGLTAELMNAFINVALNHHNGGSYSKNTGFTFFEDGMTGQSQMQIAAFEAGEASGGLQGALTSFASMGSYTGADSGETTVLNNVDVSPGGNSVSSSIFDREPGSMILGYGDFERAAFWAGEGDISRTILYSASGASDLIGLAAVGKGIIKAGGRLLFRNAARTSTTALRQVGKHLESVSDVMANPNLLSGKSLAQVRGILGKSQGWVDDVMRRSSRAEGWVFREMNKRGTDFTGRMIQYHPGTPRHFGGNPYWKVSSGSGTVRIPLN